jgi:hypothetical protein
VAAAGLGGPLSSRGLRLTVLLLAVITRHTRRLPGTPSPTLQDLSALLPEDVVGDHQS